MSMVFIIKVTKKVFDDIFLAIRQDFKMLRNTEVVETRKDFFPNQSCVLKG